MATEITAEEVQAKLLKVRQEQGISETVKPIRSIAKKQSDDYWRRCEAHNRDIKIGEICPECAAERARDYEKEQELIAEQERLEKEKKLQAIKDDPEKYLAKLGIGKRHIGCSLDNYEGGEKIKQLCRNIIEKPCDVLLTGLPGCGKTHLAIAIFRELLLLDKIKVRENWYDGAFKKNAFFTTVPDLLLDIRQAFKEDAKITEEEIVDSLSKAVYLILDDLGSEKTTEWSITTLYTIIDRRYRENKITIVTTNLTIDQIASNISERIASRLASGKIIKINAPDFRKKR